MSWQRNGAAFTDGNYSRGHVWTFEAARENARSNGVEGKTAFFHSDSFRPFDEAEQEILRSLKGHVSFVLANPPASDEDDGFAFRRRWGGPGQQDLWDPKPLAPSEMKDEE
ncbi:MAG: hypothetical protein KY476_26725 [Planctomycetes bacterium]|nr:hypothetical protein [Planctomycetota bacterium]